MKGIYVNDKKIPAKIEYELHENDVICFTTFSEKADLSCRKTYIFKVKSPEIVEISDDDSLKIFNDPPVSRPDPITYNKNKTEAMSENIIGNQNEPEEKPTETRATADIQESKENENHENDESSSEMPHSTTSGDTSLDPQNDIASDSDYAVPTRPSTSKSASKDNNYDFILKQQTELRRWDQRQVKLIDPPNMKRSRLRKASFIEVHPDPLLKRKQRGPRKQPDFVKEKLRKLTKYKETKVEGPKLRRSVRVKFTKANRGEFLLDQAQQPPKATKKTLKKRKKVAVVIVKGSVKN